MSEPRLRSKSIELGGGLTEPGYEYVLLEDALEEIAAARAEYEAKLVALRLVQTPPPSGGVAWERDDAFPIYHYSSGTDPQTGKQKPYMPAKMVADFATPPPSGDVEAAWEALYADIRACLGNTANAATHLPRFAVEAAIRAEYEATIKSLEQRMAGYMLDAAQARAEPGGLDVERLMRAADNVTEGVDITPWTPIWWREVAAEYERLAEGAE